MLLPLRSTTLFTYTTLFRSERNIFNMELHDAVGTKQKTVPDHHVYTVGAVVEEQPLINSMGVGLKTNEVAWYFKKGVGLPQRYRSEEHTSELQSRFDLVCRL